MIIACPKCQQRHDVSQRKPGEVFNCTCGNAMAAPKKSGGPTWFIVLAIIGACAVPCMGVMAAIAIPNFVKYQLRSKSTEGRMNVAALRTAELAYFAEHGRFVAAGPVPATVPGSQKAQFEPDDGFTALGWNPGTAVYFQYEVQVTGPQTAVVTARGDVDGDGEVAEWRVELSPDGTLGDIRKSSDHVF